MAEFAAERPQRQRIGLRFNAFGGDAQAQIFGECDDGLDQRTRFLALAHALDEGAIDLQNVERQFAQMAQARIAGAEIVERDVDALVLQRDQNKPRGVEIRDERVLGDLDFEPCGRKAASASTFSNFCGSAASFNWTGEMLSEMRGAPGQLSASVAGAAQNTRW